MKALAPNLFQRRFQDFVEMGRARLPSLAPEWTDHNAHDPGITLMELLAWVAEAQLYSLSRMRRDERAAYAALLGIAPHGTQSASGLIWPDRLDPNSPAATFAKTLVLTEDTVIETTEPGGPTFRPVQKLLWVPGRIVTLETRGAKGRATDHTATNARGGLPFFPFGDRGGRRNVLALTFECRDSAGLFGKDRKGATGAYWPIGILAAPPVGGATETAAAPASDRSTLSAALVTDNDRINLPIAADTTNGLLATGTLLLNLDNVAVATGSVAPSLFTIELRSRTRVSRPPRLLRIEPNVVPITQRKTIGRESQDGMDVPDFSFKLEVPGLRFAAGEDPLTLEVASGGVVEKWERREGLSNCGPKENVYELDSAKSQITFGNGVNGRMLPAKSKILVTYSVSDGAGGSVARNRKWKVAGFGNTFGVNPDPITGGGAPSALLDDRREARRRVREDHALISSTDIESAAKALPLLEVARAWVPAAPNQAPRTGVVPLVALRSRAGGEEPEQAPETVEWLNEIRRQLSPQMPLGSRLMVTAPFYVEFFITAVIEANAGLQPAAVKEAVENKLKQKLALVDTTSDLTPRPPGVPVTLRDVGAWVRAAEGVKRVIELELHLADGQKIDKKVVVPRNGLPRCLFGRNSIEVKRPEPGRSR
jgi:hypothetical protein